MYQTVNFHSFSHSYYSRKYINIISFLKDLENDVRAFRVFFAYKYIYIYLF